MTGWIRGLCAALALVSVTTWTGCDGWQQGSDDTSSTHAVVHAAGWSTGENGAAIFRVFDCGAYAMPCSFDHSLVTHTSARVLLEGFPTTIVPVIEVEDPGVVAIEPEPDSTMPGVLLRAIAPGQTRLVALTSEGVPVNAVDIRVVSSKGLAILPLSERMVRASDDGETQRWQVPSDESLSLYLVPEVEETAQVMGKIDIDVIDVSEDILTSMVEVSGSHIGLGVLAFTVPEGDHPFIVESPDGAWSLRAVFEATPMAPPPP